MISYQKKYFSILTKYNHFNNSCYPFPQMAHSILLQIFVSKFQIILFSQLNKIVFPINKYFLNTFVKVF